MQEHLKTEDGKALAVLFKYYRQDQMSKIVRHIPLQRIRAKTLYLRYMKIWNKLAAVLVKYNISFDQYIRFLVFNKHCTEYSQSEMFFSKRTFMEFRDYLQSVEKRKNVYRWFEKSANNIADICIRNGYVTTRECIAEMIKNKTIGKNYVCGIVSKYFFAAIPRFNEIIDKLDYFSKSDLVDIRENYDIYNTEINNAFLFYRNRRVNPFEFTDDIIDKIKNGKLSILEK